MIIKSLYEYIRDFILKSGEDLEWNQHNNEDSLIEVKIIKRSERIYRILGLLLFSNKIHNTEETFNDSILEVLAFTIRKKIKLDDRDRQTFRWLEEGWIIREVRFEKDGKTARSSYYRMGFRLYQYEQLKDQKKVQQIRGEFLQIKNHFLTMLEDNKSDKNQNSSYQKELGIQNITKIINLLKEDELNSSLHFPKTWPLGKRLKYLHFISAFCKLSRLREEFDWKEIGAVYFQKIGGSKEFDSYKQEFIVHLEEWANIPAVELGLTSLGQITPLFFAGQLSGKYSNYDWGPVHSLTNLSIVIETYQTKATTVWLVENRAILTRMATTEHFLKSTNSLIICVDGHLRSSHKKAISQILLNSEIEQIIIWCDYDPDGLQISKEIHLTVTQNNQLTIKWILPDQQMTGNLYHYEQYLTDYLQNKQMEQEQIMGGVEQWNKWILD